MASAVESVVGEVEVLVVIEDEGDALRVPAVGALQGGRGVELLLGDLEEDGAVPDGDGDAADPGVREGVLVVHLDRVEAVGGLVGVHWRRRGLLLVLAATPLLAVR